MLADELQVLLAAAAGIASVSAQMICAADCPRASLLTCGVQWFAQHWHSTAIAQEPDCLQNIVQVPTFIFYRNGKEVGRHVGSSRGDLIGKILEQQAALGIKPPSPSVPAGAARRRTSANA